MSGLATAMMLVACSGSAQDGPGASSAEAAPASSALARPDLVPPAPAPPPVAAGAPALAPSGASAELREAAARRVLQGEADPKLLAVQATEPGVELDSQLRDQLAPRSRPPSVRMGKTTVTGRLPPEVIQRIVRQNFGRFRLCYENGLRSDPELEGEVTVHFTIDATGAVSSVKEQGSTMKDPGVRGCVAKAFNGLSFPQPEGGTVAVTYPIKFLPAVQ